MDDVRLQSFPFTVEDCTYYEAAIEAPDLETAVEIAEERWLNGGFSEATGGFLIAVDDNGGEIFELACW